MDELTKDEIISWYLPKDYKMDEKFILSIGFQRFAHVTRFTFGYREKFYIYKRVLCETEESLLDIRYCFYNGYAGIFLTTKTENKVGVCFEQFGSTWLGRGFKLFLRHRALKYIELLKANKKIKIRNNSFLFDDRIFPYRVLNT